LPSRSSRHAPLLCFLYLSYPLYFQSLAHSFALKKMSTLLFSISSALFAKNHPGWGLSKVHSQRQNRGTIPFRSLRQRWFQK
jgi:hypothetical protein